MKIAVLFNQFGPYHYARLNALGKKSNLYGIEFFSKSDTYKWNSSGFDKDISFVKQTLFDVNNPASISKKMLASKVFDSLNKLGPDVVVINGWSETGALAALKWCLLNQKPRVVMSDSTEFDEKRLPVKEMIKKRIVGLFSSAIVGGIPHKKYINKLGMSLHHIYEKYDVIDNNYFISTTSKVREDASFHRNNLNLPKNYFLASARFVSKKNLERLLEGYSIYAKEQQSSAWSLVLLGDGDFKGRLEDLIDKLGIRGKVKMPGFKQYDELPFYYGLANAFVHSSTTEQWGLVVNEAMASKLPILISEKCGCAEDLVIPPSNGLIFNPYSASDIAEKMNLLSSGKYNLEDMSRESLKIITNYSTDHFANNLILAATTAVNKKIKFKNFLDILILNFLIYK